jgi:adenosine kinase
VARILICGTLAYDDIGAFHGMLTAGTRNVKLERLDRRFGGCAMNVAYNLAGLGHEAVPFVYAGDDYAGDYARHVAASGISEAGIHRIAGTPSARGLVLTGGDGTQFTAFYPGPSGLDRWAADLDELLVAEAAGTAFAAALVVPDLPDKMLGCLRRLTHLPLRIWCPGQYAELLDATILRAALATKPLLVLNHHEWQALCRQIPAQSLLADGRRAVVTDGPHPVMILPGATAVPVPAPESVVDPTGCGDALLAALTDALLEGVPLSAAVAAGIRLAQRCLGRRGAQYHEVQL